MTPTLENNEAQTKTVTMMIIMIRENQLFLDSPNLNYANISLYNYGRNITDGQLLDKPKPTKNLCSSSKHFFYCVAEFFIIGGQICSFKLYNYAEFNSYLFSGNLSFSDSDVECSCCSMIAIDS